MLSKSNHQPLPCRPSAAARVAARPIALIAARMRFIIAASTSSDSHEAWALERREWTAREQMLLSELKAVRGQVDKLLDQQHVLISMIASASHTSSGASTPDVAQRRGADAASSAPPTPPLSAAPSRAPEHASPAPSPSSGPTSGSAAMQQLFREWGVAPDQTPFDPAASSFIADAMQLTGSSSGGAAASEWRSAPPGPATAVDTPESSAAGLASGGGEAPVSIKAAINSAPPELMMGEDDIYWMSKLHDALLSSGFGSGDEEMECWEFGEGTREAVFAFQASASLYETGIVDRATWNALLEQHPGIAADIAADIGKGTVPNVTSAAGRAAQHVPQPGAAAEAGHPAAPEPAGPTGSDWGQKADGLPAAPATFAAAVPAAARKVLTKWPLLQDGDGGAEVRAMQAALTNAGFYCGEEDMQWWMVGNSTRNALMAFQASVGLHESGVCDVRSWLALLGPSAQPSDLYDQVLGQHDDAAMRGDDDDGFEDDMTESGGRGVWLLGEQRWEKKRA